MKLNLKTLLNKGIFKEYTIETGADNLDTEIMSMSILETPDFKNYIIENSLILTTFYPIKSDVTKTLELLDSLKRFNTAGLIVKIHRYIDDIPQEVINHARNIDYPIVTLNYDANLSILFNNIMSEIQSSDFESYSLEYSYSDFLSKVYENPTTKTLMDTVESIDEFDLLIHNLEDNTIHHSSEAIMKYYKKYGSHQSLIQRDENTSYYSEDVIYENKAVYRMFFQTSSQKRHIIHNYIEIFKLMIVIIYQKKMENSLKQNRFLFQFLSDRSSVFTKPQIIEATKKYNWDITFPVTIALFNITVNDKSTINPTIIDYINTVIVNKFHIHDTELRHTYIEDNLIFIINTMESINIYTTFSIVHNIIEKKFPKYKIKLAYSDTINDSSLIPKKYNLLSSSMLNIIRQKLSLNIYTEDYIELINLMRKIDHQEIVKYVNKLIKPLIEYEKNHNLPLTDTLYEYISSKFSVKETAEKLFIHYNTLRYRLELISKLGIDVSESSDFFSVHFALYLYKNLEYNILA